MVSGAAIIELMGQPKGVPVRFTVANTLAIEKGDILRLKEPRTASGCLASDVGVPFCGIAAEEKVASDGATSIGVWTKGIFDCVIDTALPAGSMLRISGCNELGYLAASGIASVSGGEIVGKLLEDSAAGEVCAVALGIY